MPIISSAALRRDISQRNIDRARNHGHELSYGPTPSVIYCEEEGKHGNFLSASYRAICAHPEWHKRLRKSYTGARWVPRAGDRSRCELDCANSSDALLMNVFCYPKVLLRAELCSLLGIEPGLVPKFGFRPRIPLTNGRGDATEVDMKLGDLLVEAKLTETGFQTAARRLVLRYRDLGEVFDVAQLPGSEDVVYVYGYQLIRGALAAFASDSSFLLLCDGRRKDLIECWFDVVRAVRSCELRCRLKLLTWQEIAETVPRNLRMFLNEKYGITDAGT
jgi:hypothetical protein